MDGLFGSLAMENERQSPGPVRRPLMRYFGGKWILAKWVLEHFPTHHIYVEPYGGAASVLLQKDRAFSEVYNDIYDDIVNLFRVLRDRTQAAELTRALLFTPYSREELELAFAETDEPVERARRTMIRAWMGYGTNGTHRKTGFRTNIKAQRRSTPARDWNNVVHHMDRYIARLRGVAIENKPAVEVIQGHDTNETLFYVDPPYPTSTRRGERYQHEMNDQAHRDLAQVLRSVEGMVVISGYPCNLYDNELYPDWK
jgi:DNA adenine methylase